MNFVLVVLALAVAVGLTALWWKTRNRRDIEQRVSMGQLPSETIDVDGWIIRYHQSGQGPHLVLVHGLGANLICWRWIVKYFAPKFTVTALDLPGFGQSSKLEGETYGLDEQAERLEKILNALSIRESYLVGNSMGGNIVLWFALRFPEQAKALCVIAPATSPSLVPLNLEPFVWLAKPAAHALNRMTIRMIHKRTVSKRELIDDDRVQETLNIYKKQGEAVRSFLKATSLIRDVRLSESLHKITTPLLILWGSKDKLVSRRVIDALEKALPQAESFVHIGGGHHLQEDEPEWVAEKVTSFFLRDTH